MATKDTQKALEIELESAVKTLANATNDLKSISEAKAALVIGQKKLDDLTAALVTTADAQNELTKTLHIIASSSQKAEADVARLANTLVSESKKLNSKIEKMQEVFTDSLVSESKKLNSKIEKMQEVFTEHEDRLWLRTGIGLGAIGLLLLVLLLR